MVSAQPLKGVPTIDLLIQQAYLLNQEVEANQPGTDATATIMDDKDKDVDKAEADSYWNNKRHDSSDRSDNSMDWNTPKATIAHDKNAMQKRKAKGKIISLDKGVAQKETKNKMNFSGSVQSTVQSQPS